MAKQYFVKGTDLNLISFNENVRREIYKNPNIIYDRLDYYIMRHPIKIGDVITVLDSHGKWVYDIYATPCYYTYVYDGSIFYDISELHTIDIRLPKTHWDNIYKSPKEMEG